MENEPSDGVPRWFGQSSSGVLGDDVDDLADGFDDVALDLREGDEGGRGDEGVGRDRFVRGGGGEGENEGAKDGNAVLNMSGGVLDEYGKERRRRSASGKGETGSEDEEERT